MQHVVAILEFTIVFIVLRFIWTWKPKSNKKKKKEKQTTSSTTTFLRKSTTTVRYETKSI
jgi:NhaP-type Na+/H+ or K+/H+ antiporter